MGDARLRSREFEAGPTLQSMDMTATPEPIPARHPWRAVIDGSSARDEAASRAERLAAYLRAIDR